MKTKTTNIDKIHEALQAPQAIDLRRIPKDHRDLLKRALEALAAVDDALTRKDNGQ